MPLHATIYLKLVGQSDLADAIRAHIAQPRTPRPDGKAGQPAGGLCLLARQAQIDQSALHRWLAGKRSMSLADLQTLAKIVGYKGKIL